MPSLELAVACGHGARARKCLARLVINLDEPTHIHLLDYALNNAIAMNYR